MDTDPLYSNLPLASTGGRGSPNLVTFAWRVLSEVRLPHREAMTEPELSIIVTSHETRDLTLACLESVFATIGDSPYEVIVVDNASTDGSQEAIRTRFPAARLLALAKNVGFANANNDAAELARGEYICLLNPDTVVLGTAMQTLLAFARAHPEAGICGGRTLFADRTLNPSSCWGQPTFWSLFCRATGLSVLFRRSPLFDTEAIGDWRRDTVREVDIIAGCFLMIRRELWQELGGFDRALFMYGEDIDLSIRVRKLGYKCLFCPDAEIIHLGGASVKIRSARRVNLFQAKSYIFKKHWKGISARIGVAALDMWVFTRMVALFFASKLKPGRLDDYVTWRDSWKRRQEWRV